MLFGIQYSYQCASSPPPPRFVLACSVKSKLGDFLYRSHDLHRFSEQTEEFIMGKRFSCACGGGEENAALQREACSASGSYILDPNDPSSEGTYITRFDWTIKGMGTDESPGSVDIAMTLGTYTKTFENIPGRFDYLYPIGWSGVLDGCKISQGPCMDVPFTNVKDKLCNNYVCETTDISCPPYGLPECPGGANSCDDVPGTEYDYRSHKVSAAFLVMVRYRVGFDTTLRVVHYTSRHKQRLSDVLPSRS